MPSTNMGMVKGKGQKHLGGKGKGKGKDKGTDKGKGIEFFFRRL